MPTDRLLPHFRFLCLVALLLASTPDLLAAGLHGDQEALARVDRMYARLGGKALWAGARSLHTIERARDPKYGDGIVATYWRNLEAPGERVEYRSADLNLVYAWDEEGGWMMRDGKVTDFTGDEIRERAASWRGDLYTLFHQLAAGTRNLEVRSLAPDGFDVLDEAGSKMAEYHLTRDGDLYRWRQFQGDTPTSWVYGPHRNFGDVSFPDWGTSSDGDWGFYYLAVEPSDKPFSRNASTHKPKTEWLGGALHPDNCDKP
ncbi:MAG: hypothetical protein KDI19_10985 [Pseudomonadales bacterium]|nr:hypothetical protein [Pseudomonadales bacterium]